MMKYSEKDILRIIRWTPFIFIVLLSVIVTFLEIRSNKAKLNNDIQKIKQTFIKENNNKIIHDVDRAYNHILYTKNESEKNLKNMLKSRVYEAHQIANNIYLENKEKSKKEILKLVKDALRDIRFNDNRGYYFMHDEFGNNQLYPLDKNVEGNNYSKLRDIKGYLFVQKIMEVIKNKTEGFDSYYWSKPIEEKVRIFKKFAFYKYFEPLNMTISSGEYIADFENDLKSEILEYIKFYNANSKDYIFIVDNSGKILSHRNNSVIGFQMKDYNKKLSEFFNKIRKNTQLPNSFINYVDSYNESQRSKVSYVRLFEEWKWMIGTGYYKDELDLLVQKKKDELNIQSKENIIRIIEISLLATFMFLLISWYLTNLVRKRFLSYNEKLIEQLNDNRKKDTVLAQQSKMASMGEMLANIAHQWRQPLSVISTASSGLKLKKEFGMLSDKELLHGLDQITDTTSYLSKTIDDFRNFFKKDKHLNKTSAIELWSSVYNLLGHQFEKQNIDFILNIKDCEFNVLRNELIQVLINVLNNSKDHLILRKVEKKLIFIDISVEDENVYIKIKDNARGVKEKILERIFEPYFTTKHKAQGTGIGLYMCEQIVTNNINGKIHASNVNFEFKGNEYKGLETIISIPSNLAKKAS